jgi:alkylhydroperoxidase family enzyme
MEALERAVLETPGELDTKLRRAIAAGRFPDDLAAYLEKVSKHAYKVVDRDVERLKEAGYSEDAIFEATLAAALGAARYRLERGLAAVEARWPA